MRKVRLSGNYLVKNLLRNVIKRVFILTFTITKKTTTRYYVSDIHISGCTCPHTYID